MVVVFDIETLGLDAFEHQIVLIGMKMGGEIKQWKLWIEEDELKMISKCLEALNHVPLHETVVGYNVMKFDVPFIQTRLTVHKNWSNDLWRLLYRDRKWLDLYQFLGNDFRRMSYWLEKLGIKGKYTHLLGRDMPRYYKKKKFREIIQHNKDDLETAEQLYLKLREEFPQLFRL